MKRVKFIFIGISVLMMLVVVAFIPIILSRWNDRQIFKEIVVEDVKEKKGLISNKSKLSKKEKIELLYGSNYQTKNFTFISQSQTKSKTDIDKVKKDVFEELKKLQQLNIMENFNFDEDSFNNFSYETITCVKNTDPETFVVVKQIGLSNEKEYIDIWMDDDDNTIYRYQYQGDYLKEYNTVESRMTDRDDELRYLYSIGYLGLSEDEVFKYCLTKISAKKICFGIVDR